MAGLLDIQDELTYPPSNIPFSAKYLSEMLDGIALERARESDVVCMLCRQSVT